MEIQVRTLEGIDEKILYEAFQKGFEDYLVPLSFTFDRFLQNNVRRGFSKEISMGAFSKGKLVGFVLNGKRSWNGEVTAYDLGTAVFKEYRGQGITSRMLKTLDGTLAAGGVKKYLLEVIQKNEAALNLYLKQGFKITRGFECLKCNANDLAVMGSYPVKPVLDLNWEEIQRTWDQKPSWQCSVDSVRAIHTDLKLAAAKDGDLLIGYGIADPHTSELIQIGVKAEYRGRGIGASIVRELFQHPQQDALKVLNVESGNQSLLGFLHHIGFQETVSQYEMIKELGK